MQHPYGQALADLYVFLLPEMALVLAACVLFVGGLFKSDRRLWGSVALGGLALALLLHVLVPTPDAANSRAAFGVPLLFDALANFTRVLALVTGILFVLLAWDEAPERNVADHHACFLLIIAGVSMVGSANDLIALFLALELISIPTYVLLYLPRHDDAAQEASLKYFLLSILSSAFLLFGFSYLFGLTGTTNITGTLEVLYGATADETKGVAGLAQVALLMIVAGLGFRITAAPFHFYAPDVFQGTSTSGAALLSYIPKIAGFVALLRVFGYVIPAAVNVDLNARHVGIGLSVEAPTLFLFLAGLTMTVGNVLALLQDNLKRLFAYSSIAHAGYMLVAVASAPYLSSPDSPTSGVAAVLFYLAAYGTMTFGVFAAILMLHRPERPVETVDDLAGLAKSHPLVALMLTGLLLSLIGFPLTAGFTGKFLIFLSAISVQAPNAWLYPSLAFIGVVNAAIGAWYYLRLISVMYLRGAVKPIETPGTHPARAALIACAALTLILSVPPAASWIWTAAVQTTARPVQVRAAP